MTITITIEELLSKLGFDPKMYSVVGSTDNGVSLSPLSELVIYNPKKTN